MKNYLLPFFLFISITCFAQLTPISQFKIEKINKDRLRVIPMLGNPEYGNSVAVFAAGEMFISILDEEYNLVKGKKILLSGKNQCCGGFYQDENNIYRFYLELVRFKIGDESDYEFKMERTYQGTKIDKLTLKDTVETLLILDDDEKVFCTKIIDDAAYLITFVKELLSFRVFKFRGTKLVSAIEIKDNNFELIPYFDNNSITPDDVFFEDENLYFTARLKNKNEFSTRLFKVNLTSKTLSSQNFVYSDFNEDPSFEEVFKLTGNAFNSLYTSMPYENRLLQLIRGKEAFYLNVFDMESGEILNTQTLIDGNTKSNLQAYKVGRKCCGDQSFFGDKKIQ